MSDPIFALLIAAIGGLIGSSLRVLIGGRKGFLSGCFLVALAGGIASNLAAASLFASALGVAMAVAIVVAFSLHYKSQFALAVIYAPKLVNFALSRFDQLDVDGDGAVTMIDLWDAGAMPVFDRQETIMIRLLERELHRIGHVVGTSIATSPMGMHGGVASIEHYGISREDLEKYPAKIRALYEREFGERLGD